MTRKAFLYPVLALIGLVSCNKYSNTPDPVKVAPRQVQFELFTSQDFSADTHTILFTLQIKNGDHVLWDSALAPMQVRDIPDQAHKISVLKDVPGDNGKDLLTVGFLYEIVNIGYSWNIDTLQAGTPLKVLSYDFR